MIRAVIYARYSSENQRDASIEDQLRVCRARAEREGWDVIETFADHATSGATNLRPGYQAMLAAFGAGKIDLVMAESLDRFSRDLEHIASFYKHCVFRDIRIHTLAEGVVSELHIGLKGTMGALYLKDLADKTRRGLEGKIHAGRQAGSPAYGYSVVRQLRDDGELDRGLRAIEPIQAAIVKRIFEAYADGASPRRIAQKLNAENIAAPGGRTWFNSSILGRPKRSDGLLRNQLYIGRVVWRRRINAKDPVTGARVRRDNPPDTYLIKDVPHLRIVDDDLWVRVQARLHQEAAPRTSSAANSKTAFWDRRRPRHLLSGKVFCGGCGRMMRLGGQDYLRCDAAAHGTCHNRRTIRRGPLEAHVMELLARQLMQPELVAEFIKAYHLEWQRLVGEMRSQAGSRQREHAALDRKIDNLVDAVADGRGSKALLAKLAEYEAQRGQVGDEPELPATPPLAQNPAAGDLYASRIRLLSAALAGGDDPGALEAARSLIEKIVIHPPNNDGDRPGVELRGELMALLAAAGLAPPACGAARSDPVLDAFVSSVKADPGAEPLAFLRSGAFA